MSLKSAGSLRKVKGAHTAKKNKGKSSHDVFDRYEIGPGNRPMN
jgi:hypothetical protein